MGSLEALPRSSQGSIFSVLVLVLRVTVLVLRPSSLVLVFILKVTVLVLVMVLPLLSCSHHWLIVNLVLEVLISLSTWEH